MQSRRQFLGAVGLPAAAALTGCTFDRRRLAHPLAELAAQPGTPQEIAADEEFWAEIARAFTVGREIVNLNNGGCSPSPAWVQEAMKRHLDFSNDAPPYHMWRILEPRREHVRQRLARQFGVDAEEIALTRNASESLQICQLGFDLRAGDQVLTTTQDYPRMLTTFRQRERREGIELVTFDIPAPCANPAEIVALFAAHITPRTRLILVSHMGFLNGQVLPVREVAALGRERGIPVIVDGAHSLAHWDFTIAELECDYFASSLHKWLFAPHGTGLLYVRRERIEGLWPLMAAKEELATDIRKFEEIGTHPAANTLAIAEALSFHLGLGPSRKAARLVHLRDRWAKRLATHARARLFTSLEPGHAYGIATIAFDGLDSGDLADWLLEEHGILVAAVAHEQITGLRVSPSVYTMLEEIDRFVDAIEHALRHGLPG
jgi:selenocysteine lyase/cysteine desulfurase